MLIINNQAHKKMETEYSTSIMKITNNGPIADAGAYAHFVVPGTLVKNLQQEIKPITINLPEISKLRSTQTYNLYIEGIPEMAKLSHIVPRLAHTFLI